MISVNATLQDILDADAKKVSWLATTYEGSIERNWSTKNYTYDGTDYYNRIDPKSFGPLEFNSSLSHYGIMAPNRFKFEVIDEDEEFDESEFEDQTLTLTLVLSDWSDEEEVASWLFYVKRARRNNGVIEFECKDFFSKYLEGDYPNTELLSSLAPDDTAIPNDNMCVPLIFGTAYIPTRSLYITDARYYLLGPDSPTYTISEFRTPINWDSVSIWDNTYTYTQATKSLNGTDYKVVSPIIVDSDNDGTPDATGLFFKNGIFQDGNIKLSRNDTTSLTSPEDVIEYILEDMGVPSEYIDTESGGTFASAGSTYSGWSLTFNGGFFYKMSRMEALATVLRMCNSYLRFTDKIELHVLSKTSQKTIIDASVEKKGEKGEPIWTYLSNVPDTSDGAYVAIPESGKPQSLLKQIPIADKSGTCSERSREIIQMPFITDTQDGQRAGILYRQRKNGSNSIQKAGCRDDWVVIQPDDVITVNDTKFGGNYIAIVQQVSISLDLTVTLKIGRTGYALDDWDDLTPDAVSIVADDSGTYYRPILQGPDDDNDNLNKMGSRAWIGNNILLDGENGKILVGTGNDLISIDSEDATYRLAIGHATYGSAPFRVTKAGVLTATGATISGTITATAGAIGGWDIVSGYLYSLASGTPINSPTDGLVLASGNPSVICYEDGDKRAEYGYLSAGVYGIKGYDDGGNTCFELSDTQLMIGGWTIEDGKLTDGSGIELSIDDNRIRVWSGSNYVDMTASGLVGYDSVLGTTFTLPTDGSAPEFSSGVIKECEYQIYTSGVIQTNSDVINNGGLLINNTELKGYNSGGTLLLRFIYDGSDEGDAYIGDYDNTKAGIKYDHSAETLGIDADIRIRATHGIYLSGAASNPGALIFEGSGVTHYDVAIGVNADGSEMYINPDTNGAVTLNVGLLTGADPWDAETNRWKNIYFASTDDLEINCSTGNTRIGANLGASARWIEFEASGDIVFGYGVSTEIGTLDTSGNLQIDGDFLVDGGNIGITADSDLLALAANALTVNGAITQTSDTFTIDTGSMLFHVDTDFDIGDTYDLPDATNGILLVQLAKDGEYGSMAMFSIQATGTVYSMLAGGDECWLFSSNADDGTALCVFDNGTTARIKSGAFGYDNSTLTVLYFYS